MSDKKKQKNSKSGVRKNKQTKTQASSPLEDNGSVSDYSFTGLPVTTEQKTGQKTQQRKVKPKKKCKQDTEQNTNSTNSGYNFAAVNPYQTMALNFTPQSAPYNMSQPSYATSPPATGPFGAAAFGGYQATPPPPPPPWASKLLEDMEHVKQKLQCVEKNRKNCECNQR